MTVNILDEPYCQDWDIGAPNVTPEREESARKALQGYEADLACRFQDGGNYDTYKIATGETFVEIVCGGYLNGFIPVHCFEPLTAVQLFIDAMERYFATVPAGKVLHWRVRPEWNSHHVEEIDGGGYEDHRVMRTIYSIYARLVLV